MMAELAQETQPVSAMADPSELVENRAHRQCQLHEINLQCLPNFSPSPILDLGEDHLYSMAHEVLVAAIDPRSEISRLQQEVQSNRECGQIDTAKELTLLFHQRTEGMADSTCLPLLGLTITQAYDRWQRRRYWKDTAVDQVERTRSRLHISAALYEITKDMDKGRRPEYLSRTLLASLSAVDRVQVLSDLTRYISSQCRH